MSGGRISEGEQHFEDPINGEHIPSFELTLKKKVYQIVPEYSADFEMMINAFKEMINFPRPKKEIGKKVTNGAVTVAKMPWKFVSKSSSLFDWESFVYEE